MPPAASPRQAGSEPGEWFDSAPGRRLLAAERRVVTPLLTSIYGRVGLYLRPSAAVPAELSGNMLQDVIDLQRERDALAGALRCRDQALPLAGETLALVYAQHVFETAPDGRELAREIARLLLPEGVVLVMLLNPYSPWRLRWHARLAPPSPRVPRWLQEAGLELQAEHGVGPLWPWGSGDAERSPRGAELATLRPARLLVLRKRRIPLTPLRTRAPVRLAAPVGSP